MRGAIKLLRAEGFTFSNEVFRGEWRSIAGYAKGEWRASLQPEDKPPRSDLIQPTERFVLSPFTYVFRSRYVDEKTGKSEEGYLRLGVDEKVTIGEARSILDSRLAEYPSDYPTGVTLAAFSGAFYDSAR